MNRRQVLRSLLLPVLAAPPLYVVSPVAVANPLLFIQAASTMFSLINGLMPRSDPTAEMIAQSWNTLRAVVGQLQNIQGQLVVIEQEIRRLRQEQKDALDHRAIEQYSGEFAALLGLYIKIATEEGDTAKRLLSQLAYDAPIKRAAFANQSIGRGPWAAHLAPALFDVEIRISTLAGLSTKYVGQVLDEYADWIRMMLDPLVPGSAQAYVIYHETREKALQKDAAHSDIGSRLGMMAGNRVVVGCVGYEEYQPLTVLSVNRLSLAVTLTGERADHLELLRVIQQDKFMSWMHGADHAAEWRAWERTCARIHYGPYTDPQSRLDYLSAMPEWIAIRKVAGDFGALVESINLERQAIFFGRNALKILPVFNNTVAALRTRF